MRKDQLNENTTDFAEMSHWLENISQLDFCLIDSENNVFVSTCDRKLPAQKKLDEFRQSNALCVSNTSCCLYKLTEIQTDSYLLIVWGKGEAASTIGELAVCQIHSLFTAYAEKMTRTPLCRTSF